MCIFLIRFIYPIHIIQVLSFVCVLTWSLLGVNKNLGHAQIGLLSGFNSKFPTSILTPFICGVPPPPGRRSLATKRIRRKTGSLGPTSSVGESISLQHLLRSRVSFLLFRSETNK